MRSQIRLNKNEGKGGIMSNNLEYYIYNHKEVLIMTLKYNQILVAVDGSKEAEYANHKAI